MDGDTGGAASALIKIGQGGDHFDVYGACCAFAEIGKAALTKLHGDQAADLSRGDMWAMQILKPGENDPCETFATRFIVAYANGDKDGTFALFRAALEADGGQYVESVCALLATAVSLAHTAVQQTGRPDGEVEP